MRRSACGRPPMVGQTGIEARGAPFYPHGSAAAEPSTTRLRPDSRNEFDSSVKIPTRPHDDDVVISTVIAAITKTNENVQSRPKHVHQFVIFSRFSFLTSSRPTVDTLEKRFQAITRLIPIIETCRFNTDSSVTIPKNPDLSRFSSYRIASTQPSSGVFSCPHDSRMKHQRAYRAAIARPHSRTAGLRRPWHVDCLMSGSHRTARHGTRITGGGPLANQRVGEKAMKISTDRSTLASFKHQRGCQRNRSACRGVSSTPTARGCRRATASSCRTSSSPRSTAIRSKSTATASRRRSSRNDR